MKNLLYSQNQEQKIKILVDKRTCEKHMKNRKTEKTQ